MLAAWFTGLDRGDSRVSDVDGRFSEVDGRLRALEAMPAELEAIKLASAKPAKPARPDDLKLIEGIGPKMEKALHAGGILTFAQLAQATEEQLRAVIQAAGMSFAPSLVTWAKQSQYLVDNDMDGFKAYQERLTAGRDE
jgi:predicted flap endonuclease-1-like 5' DNA nuclease